ncbi:MAG: helix-turn-helix domain-containing protein [Oscillospiraceae bacterium]|nr:helix-turn-helix domain-containing protein [Oscillospiraceae bacterium]
MKKKFFGKGKTFYSLLGLLIVFTYVPTLAALFLTQNALSESHEAMNDILGAAQEVQLQYIQQVALGRNHSEQIRQLREYGFLEKLGQEESLNYEEQIKRAEEALMAITPDSDYGEITTCLYFVRSNYLIDSNNLGKNAISSISSITLSGLLDFDTENTETPRVFFYRDSPENDNVHSIYTACVFPEVIFIFDIYMPEYMNTERPDVSLMVNLTSSMEDVEICYYDSYGNYRNARGGSTLCSQYNYESIGPDSNYSFSFWYNGHAYFCSYTYNEDNQSKFALFCRDVIAEIQHQTTIVLWISTCVFLIIFMLFAFFAMRHTYKPLASLMKRVNSGSRNADPFQDEFAVLGQTIDSYETQLGKRDKILGKYYLLRILRGQRVDELDAPSDEWFNDSNKYNYAVAVLRVDDYENDGLYDEVFLENDIVSFLDEEEWSSRIVSDSDFLYLVFRFESDVDEKKLLNLCQRIQQKFPQYCLSIFISDIHQNLRELRRCYSEAMEISEYWMKRGQINIVADKSSIPADQEQTATATPNFTALRKLSDYIVTLSVDDALSAFDILTVQLEQAERQMQYSDDTLYNMLVNVIALAVYDMGAANSISKETLQQEIGQIRNAKTVKELRMLPCNCLQTMNKRVDGQEFYYQRFEKMRDYILEHYADPNLDSATVAGEFQLSPPSVTRLFKKYNNTGFLEFVHQTRVNKAVELLRTTNLPVSQIAAMVGYTNAATMNRAFKANVGATPGAIRKINFQ